MRKIKLLRTHTTIHVPDVGDLGSVFPSRTRSLTGLELELETTGAMIKFVNLGAQFQVFVPMANIVMADLEPELKVKK